MNANTPLQAKPTSRPSLTSSDPQRKALTIVGTVTLLFGATFAIYKYYQSNKQLTNKQVDASASNRRSNNRYFTHEETIVGGINNVTALPRHTSSSSSSATQPSSMNGIETSSTVKAHTTASIDKVACRPLVVCGPAGVGKGTLLARLMEDFPASFTKSVSHTTRQPRSGEQNGVSYHFVTVDEFNQMIDDCAFVEWAKVHENFYGTSIAAVEKESQSGKIVILEIDVQGCENVNNNTQLHPFNIFILPPSADELRVRMQNRASESEETLRIRLLTAEKELEYHHNNNEMFDCSVVNDDLDVAYEEIKTKILEFYPHLQQAYSSHIE